MTSDELRSKFSAAYQIIVAERRMRDHVFRGDSDRRASKLAEMDKLLDILQWMKNELKLHVSDPGGDVEQAALFDAPAKAKYP